MRSLALWPITRLSQKTFQSPIAPQRVVQKPNLNCERQDTQDTTSSDARTSFDHFDKHGGTYRENCRGEIAVLAQGASAFPCAQDGCVAMWWIGSTRVLPCSSKLRVLSNTFSAHFSVDFSSHRQSSTGSVVVTATCATTPLTVSNHRQKTKQKQRQSPRIASFSCPRTRSHPQTGSPEIDSSVRDASEQRTITRRSTTKARVQSAQPEVEGNDPQHGKHGVRRDL